MQYGAASSLGIRHVRMSVSAERSGLSAMPANKMTDESPKLVKDTRLRKMQEAALSFPVTYKEERGLFCGWSAR